MLPAVSVVLLLVAASLTISLAGAQDRPAGPRLGLNLDPWSMPPRQLEGRLAELSAAGVSDLRVPLDWSTLEPERGRLEWATIDPVLKQLDARGFRVLISLHGAPGWARRDPPPSPHLWLCEPPATDPEVFERAAPPTDPADLARFVERLLARHGARVDGLEIWREPNLLPGWRPTGPDPEDYGRLLAAAVAAARRAAPEVALVSAGLAPVRVEASPVCAMSDLVFLDRLARSGALAGVDAIGLQPLGLEAPPPAAPSEDRLNFRRAELARDLLQQRGVERPLWALAWGWAAETGAPAGPWGAHAPATAARWLGEAWALARRDWPWMTRMYLWQPPATSGPAASDPAKGFALTDDAGRSTPLGRAFLELAAGEVSPAPPALTADRRAEGLLARGPGMLGLALGLVLGAALLIAGLRTGGLLDRQRPRLRRALARAERLSTPTVLALMAVALLLDLLAPWPVAILALAALGLLTLARPDLALAAPAAALPFYYAFHLRLGPRPVAPVELLLALLLASLIVRGWIRAGFGRASAPVDGDPAAAAARPASLRALRRWLRGLEPSALDLLPILLVAWAGLSPLWAERPGPARYEWRTVVLEPVIYYLVLRLWPHRREALRSALDGLLSGAVLAALLGLAGLGASLLAWELPLGGAVAAEGVFRARGPYGSPNNLALWLGRALPLALALALAARGWRRRAARLALAPILLGLLATFSRGTLVVGLPLLALGMALLLRPRLDRRRLALGLGALALLALGLLPVAGSERLRGTLDLEPGSTAYIRLRLWQSSATMIADQPWLGLGLDNFLYAYRDRYVPRDVIQERALSHPHNLVLDWWTRLGLPGLALLIALVLGNLRAARLALARAGPDDRALAAGAAGMQVYALAHGLVDNHFFLVDLAAAWWIAQATLLALARPGRTKDALPRS